jgi:Ca2+-dependent lipid-binding protein
MHAEYTIYFQVISCKNVPILDTINRSSDPYVKIEFLPYEYYEGIGQTRTIYKELNPFFDEYFEL